MKDEMSKISRRDFMRGAACAAIGTALPLSVFAEEETKAAKHMSKAVLVRHPDVVTKTGSIKDEIVQKMLDDAINELFGTDKAVDAWQMIVKPNDIVGVKSNVWAYLPTPAEVENAISQRLMDAGVKKENIGIDDRGVLDNEIFKNSTALINVRPLRAHHWSGIGSCIKNYVMFDPEPWSYHDNYCANLATAWDLPIAKGKTRLNILVLLTPQFHIMGPHHYDPKFTWQYNGILVGTDPVALDSIGIEIMQKQRDIYFEEHRTIQPIPHHVYFAQTKYNLGIADLNQIELVKLGWEEGVLV